MRCYSVTMVIKNFLRPEFNRVFQEELIYTKFANFGEGLVTTFSRYSKTCKNTFISYESNEGFITSFDMINFYHAFLLFSHAEQYLCAAF